MFSRKSASEQLRLQNRELRKVTRDVERDRRDLERQEKQLEIEIKKAAKQGDKQTCTVLAKQLVQLRKQKQRTYTAASKIQGVGAQTKLMHSNATLANAMATTAKTMGEVNKQMNVEGIAKTLQEFEKQNMKMEMTDEMTDTPATEVATQAAKLKEMFAYKAYIEEEFFDECLHLHGIVFKKKKMKSLRLSKMLHEDVEDTFNSVFEESGDEEEQDAIVTKVLDEIGIDMIGKLSEAPSAHSGKLGESSKARLPTDDEIEKQLAQLKALN